MTANQTFELLIGACLVIFCLRGILPELRHYLALRRSRLWPTVHGI